MHKQSFLSVILPFLFIFSNHKQSFLFILLHIYIIIKLVRTSEHLPCLHFLVDFKNEHIYGLPMLPGMFKNYLGANPTRNKKVCSIKAVFPIYVCLSHRCVCLSHVCVCPMYVCLSHVCVSVPYVCVCLSHVCVCPICNFYSSYNFYTSHPRRASKRLPKAAFLRVSYKPRNSGFLK